MRAGTLDNLITIERSTTTVNSQGTATPTWSTLATMRAQVIDASMEDIHRAYGDLTECIWIFRTWFLDRVTVADRIVHAGRVFNIKKVKELGRRKGLEIHAVGIGAPS